MGFIPSSPDVEVGMLQSAVHPNVFLKCELNKEDKSLKFVTWGVRFGQHDESCPPIVGRYSRSGMTTIICLFHLPEISYFFPYCKSGMPIELKADEAQKAFAALSGPQKEESKP